jgi:hypothetical protein
MWVGLLYVGALGLGYVAPDPIPSPLQAALGLGLVAAGLATISTLVVRDGDHQPS